MSPNDLNRSPFRDHAESERSLRAADKQPKFEAFKRELIKTLRNATAQIQNSDNLSSDQAEAILKSLNKNYNIFVSLKRDLERQMKEILQS